MTDLAAATPPEDAPALAVRGLTVRYRGAAGTDAVRGVDLGVGPGEVVAVVGESGSGKTTICRALLGLAGSRARVEAEHLEVGGVDVRTATPRRWERLRGATVTMIPQQPMSALVPTVAVGRQLDWHLGAGAMERHRDHLGDMGLEAVLERPGDLPSAFSGGQLQRLVIAIATLVSDPALLVADEPTSTLDATVAAAVVAQLVARQRAIGAGMLYVSHDLPVVASIAHRVVVLDEGRAVEAGTVDEVFGAPRHPTTRALLDALDHRRRGRRRPDGEGGIDVGVPRVRVEHLYRYHGRAGAGAEAPGAAGVVRAVDDVSFELPPGTVTALLGESGSGKSTLARLIVGSDAPTAGTIELDGVAVGARRTLRQRRAVQLVSQNHRGAFNRRRTLRHALVQVQRVHGLGADRSERERAAARMVELVGLEPGHLDRRPRELSGGQAARMALARALLLEPEVLVLDEPTSGLDARVRLAVLDLLGDLRDRLGLTMLVITHEIPVARTLADRVVVLRAGQVREEGPADQVLTRPSDPSTQELLASVPADPRPAPTT